MATMCFASMFRQHQCSIFDALVAVRIRLPLVILNIYLLVNHVENVKSILLKRPKMKTSICGSKLLGWDLGWIDGLGLKLPPYFPIRDNDGIGFVLICCLTWSLF